MPRQFAGGRLVLATHNAGKIREFDGLLAPLGVEIVGAGGLGLAEPEETGLTFAANAQIKAEAAAEATGLPTLADDSGLAVRGLNGAPGVYSARLAGPNKDFALAMRKVRDGLIDNFGNWPDADKSASFVAVLCLCWPDGHLEFTEGRVDGRLSFEPRGQGGFGYDPIFIPEDHTQTFGELPAETKSQLSHRARAVGQLVAKCFPTAKQA